PPRLTSFIFGTATTEGTSGAPVSLGRVGRRRPARVAVLNGFTAVERRTFSSSGGAADSSAEGAGADAAAEVEGAGAAGLEPPATTSVEGSAMADGRVRSTRTDSLVVLV